MRKSSHDKLTSYTLAVSFLTCQGQNTGANILNLSKNSHFENLNFHKIHNFKVSFFTKFTGICLGLQCTVIEFARNVLGKANANSTEIDPDTPHPVVIDMPEHNQGQLGGTMRLGKRQTIFKTQDSVMRQLYGNETSVEERHRHRYEVNPNFVSEFENAGMIFVGHDADATRMEIMELKNHPFYVAVQYHPEYLSRYVHSV